MIFPLSLICSLSMASPLPNTTSAAAGADAMWVNPANLSFRRKPSMLLSFQYSELQQKFSYANAIGPLGLGVQYTNTDEFNSIWNIANVLSFRLDERFRAGAQIDWQIPSEGQTYSTWDFGMGWRPLSYLGFGAVSTRDESVPEGSLYRFGPTLNVLQSRIMLSTDVSVSDQTPDEYGFTHLLIARPIKGLQVRLQSENFDTYSAYLGIGFGDGFTGLSGSFQTTSPSDYQAGVFVGTGIDEKKVISRGREVAAFKFSSAFPYRPTSSLFQSPAESYTNLLHRIYTASRDPSVQGLMFHIENLSLSFAQIQEVHQLANEAKSRGKKIIVYLDEDAGNSAYFLAGVADRILIHPSANLNIFGLSSTRVYMRSFLELVGVEPEFIKRSEYKSAPEQYTNRESSAPAKEQTDALLKDIHGTFVETMSKSRQLEESAVQAIIDGAPYAAEEAKQKLLVDKVLYPDEIKDYLKEYFDNSVELSKGYGNSITSDEWDSARKIALLYITGVITSGNSSSGGLFGGNATGSETIVNQIDEILDSDKFKAVVIRVDSPGGSAFASEDIWRAIERLKREDIPVVISMGGAAASGGYYVSAGADRIFAEPTTITGSIGVYSGKFNAEVLLDRLGINIEENNTGRNAGIYSLFRPYDSSERTRMEAMIDETYGQFKSRVADGRGMTLEEVEQLARGRVWSGQAAKDNGLVDELGSLYDAISYAKSEAKVSSKASVHIWSIGETGPLSVASHQLQTMLYPLSSLQEDWQKLQQLQKEQYWLLDFSPYMIQ
ncbi:MAG: signal peptide peptidase SppA [Myxococcota bacterium]